MNDPHVVALRYSVSHDKSVTYKNPQPLEYKTLDFVVHAKDGRVRFEMQKHFSNIEAARDFVEPFVRAWEAEASLSFGPGQFEIRFGDAELEDRTPTLGIAQTRGTASGSSHASGSGIAVRDRYPAPPSDIAVNFEVEMMLARYSRYCQDRETLGAMANFCLTVLEGSKGRGRRAAAARKFSVDVKVLGTIGNLAGNKGGPDARKSAGLGQSFTAAERTWIEATTRILIRRAAEVAKDPTAPHSLITLSDLPTL